MKPRYRAALADISQLESALRRQTDSAIGDEARALAQRARGGEPLATMRAPFFALVREAARRTVGLRPFDEQILAALAMDDGAVVEVQTGEGKTLAAVMPAALQALGGRGVHVLTFNDYLARRDADWMGPIYRLLGLTVGGIEQGMAADARRAAYNADVTYVTAKEAGFDFLRDALAHEAGEVVHRPLHAALVDEADSILIDEARVPLVIAGAVGPDTPAVGELSRIVGALTPGVHFDADEYARDVELTEHGIEHLERVLACGPLHSPQNYRLLTDVNCALHARVLLRRDVDYIVRRGRVELVDELTGRVVNDRVWPDGLQAALEAKEGLTRRSDGRILSSITLQSYVRGYERICGMTGTARDCAEELRDTYGIDVVLVPTHKPMIRRDHGDVVFTTRELKERAVVEEIARAHRSGRPVLVGTLTIEESERLAARLAATGVQSTVLNAKNDAAEAAIVARAGDKGAVTISTNMAGRGTDIRLGDGVAALGGLYVIATNRHESPRVDRQLRGRAGRQGDPGESRFFLSLEDDLFVRYGLKSLIGSRFVTGTGDAPIDNPVVRAEIARLQRIIDGQNFEIRRTLARYAAVLEEQHRQVLERRQALLFGDSVPDVWQQRPERRAALVGASSEKAVIDAERAVTLLHIDRAWRDHLAHCGDLREGIHLVTLGGQDPLVKYTREAIETFAGFDDEVDRAVLASLDEIEARSGVVDLSSLGLHKPSATWTYLVNDDPFRNQIGRLLTGVGGATVAIYSAAILMPLLIAWGLVERLFRKLPARRKDV